jgi:hypothetical protein
MLADYEPLGFASTELLTDLLHAEINAVVDLLAKYSDLPSLFETPDATIPQRNTCFALLAHRKLIETISSTLAGRQEQPTLNDIESHTLRSTFNLVADDAPAWALEMQRAIERLPAHVYASLPEPLRRGGYNPDDTKQMEAIESAKETLSSVEQIQTLTERVIDQQLKRLARRWSEGIVKVRRPNKRKGWEQREKLYEAIRRALKANPSLQGVELCAELDKRHAPPLYDWEVSGEWPKWFTWKKAWSNLILRDRIRRVRQEAQKTR